MPTRLQSASVQDDQTFGYKTTHKRTSMAAGVEATRRRSTVNLMYSTRVCNKKVLRASSKRQ